MYLEGKITVDPSELTNIVAVKPTKGFARIAHALTGGIVSSKEERELFCAITILQQLNVVMRSVGVDNVVSITKDDVTIYEDIAGREGDLKEALDQFVQTSQATSGAVFDTLRMTLEHHRKKMTYYIDLTITRNHAVGEHPIKVILNGMPQALSAASGEDHVQTRLTSIFASQSSYDGFIAKYKALFSEFLDELRSAFSKHMSLDHIHMTDRVKIVRPKKRVSSKDQSPTRSSHSSGSDTTYYYDDPVYNDHHGFEDSFFYAWLWSDRCHSHNVHCHDCVIVDEHGADIMEVGATGFDAGSSDALNVDAEFCVPETGCEVVHSGHEFDAEIDASSIGEITTTGGDTGGGWFDSLVGDGGGWFDSFSGDGGDSGGSSCGSCGGGCGGG